MPTTLQNLSDETRDELASLALRVSNDSKTRKGFLGLVKQVSPDTPIPELDVESQISAALKGESEKREKLENQLAEERMKATLTAARKAAQDEFGLNDEQMKQMEDRMAKKELPTDYKFAGKLMKHELESATPTNYGISGHGPLDLRQNAKQMDGLMDDEVGWSQRTAHSMIDEMQKRGAKSAF